MGWTGFDRYKDKWVLCSKAKVLGGAEIDVEPVRLIDAARAEELSKTLQHLLKEELPDVDPPDLNDPKNVLGLRARAVGAKTWLRYINHSRAFVLKDEEGGLVLEEWPKEGRPKWRKKFPKDAVDDVVAHVMRLTAPTGHKGRGSKAR